VRHSCILKRGRRYTDVVPARVKQLAVFLVIGAVLNVVIAVWFIWWPAVLRADPQMYEYRATLIHHADSLGRTRLAWTPVASGPRSPGPGAAPPLPTREVPAWSRLHSLLAPYPTREEYFAQTSIISHVETCAGWPMRAMVYEYEHIPGGRYGITMRLRDGIWLPPRKITTRTGAVIAEPRAIPLRIVPVGFAINTIFFAALAAIAWHASAAVRRTRRGRGNRCLQCGYSRVGLVEGAVCPECGSTAGSAAGGVPGAG
jgi:hypothetical protein